MKSVLISTRPNWCERIAVGDKTDEIRKNAPALPTPFKCYIYQTTTLWSYPILRVLGLLDLVEKLENGKGKVIGEFVCDVIKQIDVNNVKQIAHTSRVSLREMWKYAEPKSMFDLKAWHISNLVIYDKPKELSTYGTKHKCSLSRKCMEQGFLCAGYCKLTHPPQSWCYVEEINI